MGRGNQKPGRLPGDVRIEVREDKHPVFTRRGDDLYMELPLSFKNALLGFTTKLEHLDKHLVKVTVSSGVNTGDMIKIEGEGMPIKSKSSYGDLYLTIKIIMPESLTPTQERVI